MTTQQAERAAELAAFYFHDDREPIEVEVSQGLYQPSERALVHTVVTAEMKARRDEAWHDMPAPEQDIL